MRGRCFAGIASFRNAKVVARAAALFGGEIESSRSSSRASAPLPMPLSSFFGLSPGMKRKERIQNQYDMLQRRSTRGLPNAHWAFRAGLARGNHSVSGRLGAELSGPIDDHRRAV